MKTRKWAFIAKPLFVCFCVCARACVNAFLFSSKLSALPKCSNSLAVEYNMANREPSGNKIFVEETQLSQFLR